MDFYKIIVEYTVLDGGDTPFATITCVSAENGHYDKKIFLGTVTPTSSTTVKGADWQTVELKLNDVIEKAKQFVEKRRRRNKEIPHNKIILL